MNANASTSGPRREPLSQAATRTEHRAGPRSWFNTIGFSALLLAFIACAASGTQNSALVAAETSSISFLDPEAVAEQQELSAQARTGSSLTVGRLKLSPCAGQEGGWCGSLRVPLDWADANAPEISLGFEFYPARSGRAMGTVAPIEGGPGYPSTGSSTEFLSIYEPLRTAYNVLLFDRRGTGRSSVIKCESLQRFAAGGSRTNYLGAVGDCGRQLDQTFTYKSGSRKGSFVRASGLFGTANAVRDFAATLHALQLGPVDLYGDSYGTYFAQAFTARYPTLLRSVTLDSSYSVIGLDPWYPTTLETVRDAFGLVCARSVACTATGASGEQDLRALAERLRAKAVIGSFRDPQSGKVVTRTVNIQALLSLVTTAGADRTVYRDLDGAARALLEREDALPLVRLFIETIAYEDSGAYSGFSSGLFAAATCADYPQVYSKTDSQAERERQFEAAIRAYPRPQDFAPFTVREWALSSPGAFDTQPLYTCLAWPVPLRDDPPITTGTPIAPASLPVLVLSGDLDSITPPADNRTVTRQVGPSARLIALENTLHVTTYNNPSACATTLVRAFVRQPERLGALDASCAQRIPEIRAVGAFSTLTAEASPAEPLADNKVSSAGLKLAAVVAAVAGDALFRYDNVFGDSGVGLRGGTWKKLGSSADTRTIIQLKDARWTEDASIDGWITRDSESGQTEANLTVTGPKSAAGTILIAWDNTRKDAVATLKGTIDGKALFARVPAP